MPELGLLATLSFLFWLGLVPAGDWGRLAALAALLWTAALLLGKSPLRLGIKALVVAPFALAALPLLFSVPGPTLEPWPISQPGLERFLTILARTWLGVQATLLLLARLGPRGVLQALTGLRLPPLLIMLVALMLRYVEVLREELQRLNRARSARSAGSSAPGWRWQARVTGQLAGSLFQRSLDRGERVYLAMKSRGYDGRERRLQTAVPPAVIWPGLLLLNLLLAVVSRPW